MRAQTVVSYLLATGIVLTCAQPALAETYRLPITNGDSIFKLWVDGGRARKVDQEGDVTIYEITMDDDRCITEITVQPLTNYGNSPRITIDVCLEKGFELRVSGG